MATACATFLATLETPPTWPTPISRPEPTPISRPELGTPVDAAAHAGPTGGEGEGGHTAAPLSEGELRSFNEARGERPTTVPHARSRCCAAPTPSEWLEPLACVLS